MTTPTTPLTPSTEVTVFSRRTRGTYQLITAPGVDAEASRGCELELTAALKVRCRSHQGQGTGRRKQQAPSTCVAERRRALCFACFADSQQPGPYMRQTQALCPACLEMDAAVRRAAGADEARHLLRLTFDGPAPTDKERTLFRTLWKQYVGDDAAVALTSWRERVAGTVQLRAERVVEWGAAVDPEAERLPLPENVELALAHDAAHRLKARLASATGAISAEIADVAAELEHVLAVTGAARP